MPRWSAGRRWGAVFGALVILVGIAAGATFAGLYNIAADVPHTQPTHYGNARSQSGRGTLLFRRIWMIQPASQKVRANTLRCAAVAISRQA